MNRKNKNKKFLGFLMKSLFIITLPVLYILLVLVMYRIQLACVPCLAIVLLIAMIISIMVLVQRTPKPKFKIKPVPAFGFFIGYDKYDTTLNVLFFCFVIEITTNETH